MFAFKSITRSAALLIGLLVVAAAPAAPLIVAVQTSDGHPLPGAVLTVHAVGGGGHAGVPVRGVMDQVNRAFEPDVLVIPVGSTVEFPNSDSVSHQIYSFSPARKFQLPLYRGKPYPPVHFDQVGLVTLGCNIHDSMLAYVLVTDAPYSGRADSTGSWSVDVVRGSYRVTVWHPRMREDGELKREVIVGDGDGATLTVRLTRPLAPAPLPGGGRRHSWDTY
jgi:plastocyanin